MLQVNGETLLNIEGFMQGFGAFGVLYIEYGVILQQN